MGLEFLDRVRRSTVMMGVVLVLFVVIYAPWRATLGVAAGIGWSLVNLALLTRLVVAITGPDRGQFAAVRRAGLALLGMLALFAAGAALLAALPAMPLLMGFLVPFAVLVLKAASLLLLESRLWRWLTASPWRASVAVAALLVTAWWVVPSTVLSQGDAGHASAAAGAVDSGAAHPSADEHATTDHGAEGAASGDHGAGGHGETQGPQKFANVITVLSRAFPEAGWAQFLHHYEAVIFALLVAALLCVVAYFASRNPRMIPGPLQNLVEMMVEGLFNFIAGIIGEAQAKRFVPFLGTLGLYIWCMNLFGLIPFMDSPTSSLNVTFALGLVVFIYVQWVGLRGLGVGGYVDHLLGQPRDLTGWMLAPLMLPIHLLGELAKPISLSCRLFGNIFGEDMLLVAFVSLGITALSFANLPIGLPLQLPFLLLALLTSTLQAAVFMVLSTIYILLMLPHEEHGHEGDTHHAH
jgi:F-type H+-transporting ATPase subunit a